MKFTFAIRVILPMPRNVANANTE